MRPFEGIRVIDATHVIAGPFAAYQLAVLGADVIKVESPLEPDQTRSQGSSVALRRKQMGTWFLSQNANKRSLTVNLKTESGRDVFKRLVAGADVLIENYRPGAFEALGLSHADLAALNSRLIYCSVSAFGHTGPRANQTGYDMVVQATSGLMEMTGSPGSGPVKIGSPVVDYATGMSAAFAISSALLQRERTGRGQRIDLAMFDVALTLTALNVTSYSHDGTEPGPVGNRGPSPTSSGYQTQEGLLMIAASNLRQQTRLWNAVGRPDMIKSGEAQFTTDREAEFKVLTDIFLTRSAAYWEDYLQAHHIPAARVRTMKQALQDPQLEHRRLFQTLQPDAGVDRAYSVSVAPFGFEHGGPSVERAPRPLGADTETILSELGFDVGQIAGLRKENAV